MKKKFLFLNILFAFLFLASCANGQTSNIKNLTQDEFKRNYVNKKASQILDVRTPEETAKGKIPSAKVSDFFDPKFKANVEAMKLDKSKPIVVYCAVGGRSAQAAKVLSSMGFREVLNLEGGYNSYRK